jgi:hypothetical protein
MVTRYLDSIDLPHLSCLLVSSLCGLRAVAVGGPGMYAQSNGGMLDNKFGAPILDVDIFGIPAAFLHGLFGYQYRSDALVLEPTLPGGVTSLMQKFPVRFGNSSLFLSMEGFPPPPTPPPPPPPPGRPSKRWSCQLFGCTCQGASYPRSQRPVQLARHKHTHSLSRALMLSQPSRCW